MCKAEISSLDGAARCIVSSMPLVRRDRGSIPVALRFFPCEEICLSFVVLEVHKLFVTNDY